MIRLKAEKPVEIEVSVSPDNSKVLTDPIHFGNVITNLLDNAVKYSGDHAVVKIMASENEIRVSDNGIGIDQDNLPYIFDKFYRVPTGNRHEVSGYGLGLFYVKQIIDKFGWRISVESVPGKGTSFTIKIAEK